MLAILPAVWFALAFLAARSAPPPRGDWRRSLLGVAVLGGVLVTASTEGLSALGLFARGPLALFWAATAIATAFICAARRKKAGMRWASFPAPLPTVPHLPLLTGTAVLFLIVGLTAFSAAPNTWDSMTYHLPRVAHWIQNGTVAHYPTNILRQLSLPPWAEFAMAQLELLSGSDRFANLVQWLAMGGSAIGVSLIARDLEGDAAAQAAAGALALTLPMGILQGSSTQNDYTVGFWLVCFVSFLFPVSTPPGPRPLSAWLGAAASLGLALLTKGTAYLYALPYLVLAVVLLARRAGRRSALPLFLFAAVALALNLPHFARNSAVFGSPLGPSQGLFNRVFTPRAVASNVARNAAIHLALPLPAWNALVERAFGGVHGALGAGRDDPATTWPGTEFHVPGRFAGEASPGADETLYLLLQEGFAPNPLHLVLILVTLGAVAATPAWRRRRELLLSVCLAAAAFVLFCAALKWQPWHSRLHLPLFLLWCPAVALVLSSRPRLAKWVCALLLAAALPWLLSNATRPLLGPSSVLKASRFDQYFFNRPDLQAPFLAAAKAVSSDRCPLGIETGPEDGEYLLRVCLRETGQGGKRIEHVNVSNASATASRKRPPGAEPCSLIRLTAGGGERSVVSVSRSGAGTRVTVAR